MAATATIQTGTVSMIIPAAPVTAVLKQLSKLTGQQYEARGDVGDEIVVLRVTDAKVEDLLPRLAEVTGGEWRMASDVHVLVASPAFEKRERAEMAEDERARIQKSFRDLNKQFERFPAFDRRAALDIVKKIDVDIAGYQRFTNDVPPPSDLAARQDGMPAQRLLVRLIQAIPISDFIDLPDGAKVVYSSRPNRMQRSLPSSSESLISQFVAEEGAWEESGRSAKLASGLVLDLPVLPKDFKVNLAFNDWEGGPGASADLTIFDSAHKVFVTANIRLDGWDESVGRKNLTPPTAKPGERRVEEGPDADELRSLVQRDIRNPISDAKVRANLMAKWRPKLTDPAQFEPLAYVPGALWQKLAEARNVNFVANAFEQSFSSYADHYEGPRTPSTILERLDCKIIEENGWLTMRPQYLLDNRLDRIDRPAVGLLLRASLQAGGVTIADAADYMAYHSKRFGLLAWDGGYLTAFFRGAGPTSIFSTLVRRDELRLYGLLSPQQRSQLRQRPLRLSELSQPAKQHLQRLVYWNSWASDEETGDPTELLPNGIPNDGQLTLASEVTETLVQPYINGQPMSDRNYSPRSASRLGQQFGRPSNSAESLSWNRFNVLTGHRLNFRIDYAPGIFKTFDLYEVLDPHRPSVTYDQLPADFRAEVEKAKKAAKENPLPQEAPPPP